MTPPSASKPAARSRPRTWLRPLLLLGVVGVVVLGIALLGMNAAPVWSSPGGMSSAATMPPIGGHSSSAEQRKSDLAASKHKGNKHDKGKGTKKDQSKGNKHRKGTSDQHR